MLDVQRWSTTLAVATARHLAVVMKNATSWVVKTARHARKIAANAAATGNAKSSMARIAIVVQRTVASVRAKVHAVLPTTSRDAWTRKWKSVSVRWIRSAAITVGTAPVLQQRTVVVHVTGTAVQVIRHRVATTKKSKSASATSSHPAAKISGPHFAPRQLTWLIVASAPALHNAAAKNAVRMVVGAVAASAALTKSATMRASASAVADYPAIRCFNAPPVAAAISPACWNAILRALLWLSSFSKAS
jgi:hypothetical protein